MDMRQLTPEALWGPYAGQEGGIVSFIRRMRDHAVTPEAALDMYERHMDAMLATMLPPPDAPAESPGDVRRPEGQADAEHRLGPCPKCGAEVWGIKKCPHISPPWRTFFVCDSDACGFHGRSRLTVEELRRRWPEGVEED